MGGRHPPRSLLVTQSIADDYGTSISPVRDSMQRLVGERMVETQAGGGFQVPDMTTERLRDLYHWHAELLRITIRHRQVGPMDRSVITIDKGSEASPAEIAGSTVDMFAAIAERQGNAELTAAIGSVGDRLHLVRLCELFVLKDVAMEVQSIASLVRDGFDKRLRIALDAYHRRRLRRIPQLHAALHNPEILARLQR